MELVTGRTEVTTGRVSFVPLLVISHSSEQEEEEAEEEGSLSDDEGGSATLSNPGGFLKAACILCSLGNHFRS